MIFTFLPVQYCSICANKIVLLTKSLKILPDSLEVSLASLE